MAFITIILRSFLLFAICLSYSIRKAVVSILLCTSSSITPVAVQQRSVMASFSSIPSISYFRMVQLELQSSNRMRIRLVPASVHLVRHSLRYAHRCHSSRLRSHVLVSRPDPCTTAGSAYSSLSFRLDSTPTSSTSTIQIHLSGWTKIAEPK